MENFLDDRVFLLKVNQHHVKQYSAAIMIVDFATELPIARLEGKVLSGNISVAAKSPTRRTGSLSVVFDKDLMNLTDINNLIAINKKIMLSIGMANPFYHDPRYRGYGDMLWFKQGTMIITQASSNISVGSATISINFIDKMGMLNGVCGGTIPASTSFHDRVIIDKNGDQTVEYPVIEQIIRECVNHFGNEDVSRIMVDDVPPVGRRVVRWIGDHPLWFSSPDPLLVNLPNYGVSFYHYDDRRVGPNNTPGDFPNGKYPGQTIGYMEQPLTYPGELILKAGSTVVQVLDEIVKVLGNFEYFYDVEGIFHFQKIQAYDRSENAPLIVDTYRPATSMSSGEDDVDNKIYSLYMPKFSNNQYINDLYDTSLISSLTNSPNYSNIKNDWVCWGTRKQDNKTETMVRYHLAIDERPRDPREGWSNTGTNPDFSNRQKYIETGCYCANSIWKITDSEGELVRYSTSNTATGGETGELIEKPLCDYGFPAYAWFNWREELYRRALISWTSSTRGSYYDEELTAEWRALFNPNDSVGNNSFKTLWDVYHMSSTGVTPPVWVGYNVDILAAPEKIRYWLDIIDTSTAGSNVDAKFRSIQKYSVNAIGRRSKVTENSKINEVLQRVVEDIVFIPTSTPYMTWVERIAYYNSIGQDFCRITDAEMNFFEFINSYGSCFEDVRQMMYETLIYNTNISVTAMPLFYLDVNKVIRLNYPSLGVHGDFVITQLSYSLGHAGQMQLQAHEALIVV